MRRWTRDGWLLAAVLAWALVLRLGMAVFHGFNAPPDVDACGKDAVQFERMAFHVSTGQGFIASPRGMPTAFRAPGYPMALGGLYALFGQRYFLNSVLQIVLGVATCWMVYALARRLRLSAPVPILAAWIAASLPLQFYLCAHFMSDLLAAALNVLCTLLLVAALDAEPWGRRVALVLLAGVVCGFSALTRPIALLVPFLLAALLVLSRRLSMVRVAAVTALFAAGTALVVAPWALRNYRLFDRFCLVSSSGGAVFWGCHNEVVAAPGAHWGSWVSGFDPETKRREVHSLANEVDRDNKEWELGKKFIREHPDRLPMLFLGKLYRAGMPFPQSPNRLYRLVVGVGQIFLLPLSLYGLWLAVKSSELRMRMLPILAQLGVLAANVLIFYAHERFRAAYEPLLAVLAALAVAEAWNRWSVRVRREPAVAGSGAV